MVFFNGLRVLLFVALFLSCFAKPRVPAKQRKASALIPAIGNDPSVTQNETDAGEDALETSTSAYIVESSTTKAHVGSDNENIGKAINFALSELNKGTTLQYKEQVDEVLDARQNRKNAEQYRLRFRLTPSDCKKHNSSCDTSYDPLFAKATEYTPILAPFEPPMKPGSVIFVEGRIPLKSNGFDITIQTGYQKVVEAQFRVSVRFSYEGTSIVFKHFDQSWNLDQHFEGYLQTATNFSISITCLVNHFEVAINDQILDKFYYVLPYEDATHLSISGEVDITRVTGIGPQLPIRDYAQWPDWKNDDVKFQTSVYVPFTAPLDMPLAPMKRIRIKGKVHPQAKWFSVYLQTGTNESAPEAVQLHLKSHFDSSNNKIDLQYYDGAWKGLESYDQVIEKNHTFRMAITCLSKHFQVSIDGKEIAKYDYKVPYEKATHLRIEGRVEIEDVYGIDKLPALHTFDPPAVPTLHLPLQDLPLTPGRKLKVWAFIPSSSTKFWFAIGDGSPGKIYSFTVVFSLVNSKWSLTLDNYQDGKWGTEQRHNELDWIKAGEPFQMEIEYTASAYDVRFFNNWEFSFSSKIPVVNGTHLSFFDKMIIYNVTGEYNGPNPPPPSPSPPSRICELNVWSKSQLREMWLNGLECFDDSHLLGNTTEVSMEDP